MRIFKPGWGIAALLGLAIVPASADNHHIALNNILMGGYYDGKWLSTVALHGPTWLWGGEDAHVFYPDGRMVDGVACAINRDHPEEERVEKLHRNDRPDAPVFSIQLSDYRSVSYPSHTLVLTTEIEWDVMPRKAEKLPVDNARYKALAADFLAGRGLPYNRVKLTGLQKVDLDGNGADEVIMVGHAVDGKVPFAMLRQLQQGHIATTMLSEPSDGKVTDLFTADLNGDSRMEVVVGSQSEKYIHQAVYTINQGNTDRVIHNSWLLYQKP